MQSDRILQSSQTARDSEPQPGAEESLAFTALESLQTAVRIMIWVFAFYSVANLLGVTGVRPNKLAAITGATTVLCVVLSRHWKTLVPSLRGAHAALGLLGSIALVNVVLHVVLDPNPKHTVNFAVITMAYGAFIVSRSWLISLVSLCWVGFGIGALVHGWDMDRGYFAVVLALTSALAAAFHHTRVTALLSAHQERDNAHRLRRQTAAANRRLHITQYTVDHSDDAVFWLAPDGRCLYANHRAFELTEVAEEDLIGTDIRELETGLDPSTWSLRDTGPAAQTIQTEIRARGGRLTSVELTVTPVEFGGQEFQCIFARDLTQRKLLEEKIQHSERLQGLAKIAAGFAHDFNNHLLTISGNTSVLRDSMPDVPEVHEQLDEILEATYRASLLTGQLLSYTSPGGGDSVPTDLAREVREIAGPLRNALPKRLSLVVDCQEKTGSVVVDPGQLQQIVMNLVVNAGEAVSGGGHVAIRTDRSSLSEAEASQLEPPTQRPAGTYAFVEVTDDGCGMDESTRSRIFDPFFTTKSEGRGLGLSSAPGIAKRFGGGFTISSQPDSGSTIRLYLPTPASPEAALRPDLSSAESRAGGLVLLVDDELPVRRVTRRLLERLGFDIVEAEDGNQAVAALREESRSARAVLLDMTMPGMTGLETARALREVQADLPILLTSGYEGGSADLEGLEKVRFLHKPYRIEELARELDALIGDGTDPA